jgi:nucleotide-binding universal stress UspA family protein
VWEGVSEVLARAKAGFGGVLDFEAINRRSEEAARACADEGVGHARAAGLPAAARVTTQAGTVWEIVLREAAEVGADVIVVGTRGRTEMKSPLLGSVSRALLQHADRPVLVVPPVRRAVAAPGERQGQPQTSVDPDFLGARL